MKITVWRDLREPRWNFPFNWALFPDGRIPILGDAPNIICALDWGITVTRWGAYRQARRSAGRRKRIQGRNPIVIEDAEAS